MTSVSNDLKKILELIFPSRVRVKVLTLFFTNPTEKFHMRFIARTLEEQINAVRRELLILEKTGFLICKTEGIKKYYSLNTNFPLYTDLRGLIMKSYCLGNSILKNKALLGNIKYAVLSNTYISVEKSDAYDIDLLIVGEPDVKKLQEIVYESQKEERKELFYTVISETEFETRKKRKDPVIYSLMVLPRAMIIGKDEDFVV